MSPHLPSRRLAGACPCASLEVSGVVQFFFGGESPNGYTFLSMLEYYGSGFSNHPSGQHGLDMDSFHSHS